MITKKLAHFVVETRMEDIPQEALEVAQKAITDCIGVTFSRLIGATGGDNQGLCRKNGRRG